MAPKAPVVPVVAAPVVDGTYSMKDVYVAVNDILTGVKVGKTVKRIEIAGGDVIPADLPEETFKNLIAKELVVKKAVKA